MKFIDYYNYLAHNYPIEDLKYFFALVFVFYLVLIAMRINGVLKKENCPRCYGELIRTSKTLRDRILVVLILGTLPLRRYKCKTCHHEVLRWNDEKSVFKRKKEVRNKRRRSNFDSSGDTFQ
jgi:hypothetical protein